MDNKKILSEEELDQVSGGFVEEMQDIADTFTRSGCTKVYPANNRC